MGLAGRPRLVQGPPRLTGAPVGGRADPVFATPGAAGDAGVVLELETLLARTFVGADAGPSGAAALAEVLALARSGVPYEALSALASVGRRALAPDSAPAGAVGCTKLARGVELVPLVADALATLAHPVRAAQRAGGHADAPLILHVVLLADAHVGRRAVAVLAAVVADRLAVAPSVGCPLVPRAAHFDLAEAGARLKNSIWGQGCSFISYLLQSIG